MSYETNTLTLCRFRRTLATHARACICAGQVESCLLISQAICSLIATATSHTCIFSNGITSSGFCPFPFVLVKPTTSSENRKTATPCQWKAPCPSKPIASGSAAMQIRCRGADKVNDASSASSVQLPGTARPCFP